jgi:hypothetical protein
MCTVNESRTYVLISETSNEAEANMDDDIKVKLIKMGCWIMNGIHTTQDSVQWCVFVNVLNSLCIS